MPTTGTRVNIPQCAPSALARDGVLEFQQGQNPDASAATRGMPPVLLASQVLPGAHCPPGGGAVTGAHLA